MSPHVYTAFESIINQHFASRSPEEVLEIGAGHWTLLQIEKFALAKRQAINLQFDAKAKTSFLSRCICTEQNANQTNFSDGQFDCVLSCSTLEHDKFFWKSVAEVRRILKPQGLWVVGVPIYKKQKIDLWNTTLTYARHGYAYNADFYRFSEQAVREVVMEGFEITHWSLVRSLPNPYLVCGGIKL